MCARVAIRLVLTLALAALATVRPARLGAQAPVASVVADDSLATEPTAQVGSIPLSDNVQALFGGHFRISLSRTSTATTTVRYTIGGNATAGSDYTALTGSVDIPAGATSAGVDVRAFDDSQVERDETVIISLATGTGYTFTPGSLSSAARVTVVDNDQLIQITGLDRDAAEPAGDVGSVQLERMGTLRGRLAVPLSLGGSASNGTDYIALPDSAVFPDGQASLTFTITPRADNDAEGSESVQVRVSGVSFLPSGGVSVTIVDAAVRITTSLATVSEAQGSTANFVLTRSGNLSAAVSVSYSVGGTATNGTDYNTIGTSVAFAAGAATATVPIVVRGDNVVEGAETIVLSFPGSTTLAPGSPNSATLVLDEASVVAIGSLTLTPTTLLSGTPVTGTIQLNGPAPVGGVPIALSVTSTAPNAASLPVSSIAVAAGQQSVTFTVTTAPVASNSQATVTATPTGGAAVSRNIQLLAPRLVAYAFSKTAVTPQATVDSTSVSASLTLDGPAPTGGMAFTLASSNAALVVPSSATVAAGQTTATISVKVSPVGTATSASVTASRTTPQQTASLTINPPALSAVAFNRPSVVGRSDGQSVATASVSISSPAPSTGLTVGLTTNTPLAVLSSTVTIPGGGVGATAGVTAVPVAAATNATLTASFGGSGVSGSLTVTPPHVLSLSVNPDSVIAGSAQVSGSIRLDGEAAAGFSVPMSSSTPSAFACDFRGTNLASVPATAAQTVTSFQICTRAVTARTTATLTAGTGAQAVTRQLLLIPVPPAVTIVLSDQDVPGGATTPLTGTVVLSTPAEGGQSLTLTSSDASVRFQVGTQSVATTTVTIPDDQSSVGFQLKTTAVQLDRQVTVSGSPGNATANITVRAPVVTSLAFTGGSPLLIPGGSSPNLQVNLNVPAPTAGMPIQLSSDNASVVVPAVVTVPRDSVRSLFAISTQSNPSDVNATITARTGTVSRTLAIRVLGTLRAQSLSLNPQSAVSGDTVVATLTLSGAAPAGGIPVPLSSAPTPPAHMTLPSSVTVPAGQSSITFPIPTAIFLNNAGSTTTSIQANLGGNVAFVSLTIVPFSFAVSLPNVINTGESFTGTVTLQHPAPAGGYTVTASSASPVLSIPPTITVPAGQTTTSFTVTSSIVTSNTQVSLAFTFDQVTQNRIVTVAIPAVLSLVASPTTVVGGSPFTLTVNLTTVAGASGQVVQLSVPPNSPIALPGTVTVAAGQLSAVFSVQTSAVTVGTAVQITATVGNSTRSASVTVAP